MQTKNLIFYVNSSDSRFFRVENINFSKFIYAEVLAILQLKIEIF